MNKPTSIYLDAVRFLAACAVFLCHASGRRLTAGFFWRAGPYGLEAVIVFFVLSGFVIAYVTDVHEHSTTSYGISRAARIYSVALPALVITFVLDAIGRNITPGLYNAAWGYSWHDRAGQFLAGLFFVNQVWFANVVPGSDLPYWSLGFEVWYYAIFAVAIFAPRFWREGALVLLLIGVGPRVASLLPIWLLGVLAYHVCSRRTLSIRAASVLFAASIMLWVAYEAYAWRYGRLVNVHSIFVRPEIVQDYIIGLLFCANLIGFRFISHWVEVPLLRVSRAIRWLAGATFTLYLLHLPIAQFLRSLAPWSSAAWQTRILLFAGTPALVFVLAEVTERRKNAWRNGFTYVLAALHERRIFR